MSIVHDFTESLKKSHAAEDLPLWEECYRNAFGDQFVAAISHREDGEWQRAGIDRSVILKSSKQYLIDEKIRYKDYGDILLEYMSNDQYRTPGWVCKPLRADFIAYAVAPAGVCHMLPVLQLQRAWELNGETWRGQFETKAAQNNGYKTLSVAVPVREVWQAIGKEFRVPFTPYLGPEK